MRSRVVVGNWKLNGSLAGNETLLKALLKAIPNDGSAACAVCVPYAYLAQARDALKGSSIGWGSQDCSRFEKGAYTGDVSASMVAEFGSRHAIVGHSERRAIFGDTDAHVAEKYSQAKRAGLTPIFCVGETLGERESGATQSVLARQVDALLAKESLEGGIVAYEPVWAIGTGKTATSMQAQEAHAFIRGRIAAKAKDVAARLPILYGGSVKAANAAELFAMPDVDGGLIGGASLVAEEFVSIWRSAGDASKG
jgi:triosephosphate isomerase